MLGRPLARAGRPGIIGTAARTAVVAGTATAVSGRVARHQAERAAAQQYAEQPGPQAPAPPPPGPAPSETMSADEAYSQLQRLGRLRDQGVLTEEEFAAEKARILAR